VHDPVRLAYEYLDVQIISFRESMSRGSDKSQSEPSQFKLQRLNK
jgi:hypothetical protein